MTVARLALCLLLPFAGGCAFVQQHGAAVAGGVGAAMTASNLDLLEAPYVAGALVAYAIYDPFAPNWEINVVRLDPEHVRFDLRMKALASGGEGEARQLFNRHARELVRTEGFAGYDVLRYEEGIESTRPFAHRVASGEIRLARSRTWPEL